MEVDLVAPTMELDLPAPIKMDLRDFVSEGVDLIRAVLLKWLESDDLLLFGRAAAVNTDLCQAVHKTMDNPHHRFKLYFKREPPKLIPLFGCILRMGFNVYMFIGPREYGVLSNNRKYGDVLRFICSDEITIPSSGIGLDMATLHMEYLLTLKFSPSWVVFEDTAIDRRTWELTRSLNPKVVRFRMGPPQLDGPWNSLNSVEKVDVLAFDTGEPLFWLELCPQTQYLYFETIRNISSVWSALLNNSPRHGLREVVIRGPSERNEVSTLTYPVANMQPWLTLTRLTINSKFITEVHIRELAQVAPNLEYLHIGWTQWLRARDLECLGKMDMTTNTPEPLPHLTAISFESLDTSATEWMMIGAVLGRMNKFTQITLIGVLWAFDFLLWFDDESDEQNVPRTLKYLRIDFGLHGFRDEAMFLPPGLQRLEFVAYFELQQQHWEKLVKYSAGTLEALHVRTKGGHCNDSTLKLLCGCPNLRSLRIDISEGEVKGITNEGIEALCSSISSFNYNLKDRTPGVFLIWGFDFWSVTECMEKELILTGVNVYGYGPDYIMDEHFTSLLMK